jgi:tripartite-type tricarboxylate transporter receptor subunit TctC
MRSISRFTFLCIAICGVAAVPCHAQTFPAKPVRLIVPFPAGGPADMLARVLGEKVAERWGQQVVVENRGGAAGNIGAELVARAAPDGHVVLLNASSHVINGILYSKLPYDPIKDFTPITQVASYQHMFVVHPSVPARTVKEFVALAKSKPGQIAVANSGSGTPGHLAAELFMTTAGVKYVHVPYKGSAPATTDLLGGQVSAMFNNPVNTLPYTSAGKLRALAVTGTQRLPVAPEIPTVAESGYADFEAGTWFGLFGPAGVPPAAVTRIHDEFVRALRLPDVRQKLAAQGWDLIGNTPSEFAAVIKSDHDKWSKVIRAAGLRAD